MTAIHYNLGWPNKPMVRTATRALAEPARRSRQRHIGQPLGRGEWSGLRGFEG